MAYLVENHYQTTINSIRNFLVSGHGFETTFSRHGEVKQILNVFYSDEERLTFEWYRNGEFLSQYVSLVRTHTNFNGYRLWYVCPNCGRRCGSLFDFGGAWWCRKCGDLKYSSASGSKSERPWLKIHKTLSKVRYGEYMTDLDFLCDGNKPKWMRWKTWEVIKNKHNDSLNREVEAYIARNLEGIPGNNKF